MRKITFEQVKSDLYEEITEQGLKVLVAPLEGCSSVYAGIYVETGAFRHEEMIGKTRIPAGIAHFMEHMLFHTVQGSAMSRFEELGASSNAYTTHSYTAFYFSTTEEDYQKPLDQLLAMTSNLTFTEEEVDSEREIILAELDQDLSDPSVLLTEEVKNNLYLDSPIKDSILGTAKSIKDIHLSNLKKYFLYHYDLSNMTLIVTGHVQPEEIHALLEARKFTNKTLSEKLKEEVKLLRYREEYGQVHYPFTTRPGAYDTKTLGLGIKFLPRMELYERYGDDLFAIYELLPQLLFGNASAFIERQDKLETTFGAEDIILDEGAEDALLYLSFASEKPEELQFELKNYLSTLHKKVKSKDFRLLKRSYIGRATAELAKPDELFFNLLEGYANHLAYPALVERISSLSFKVMKAFLKDMESWPYAMALLTKKEGTTK